MKNLFIISTGAIIFLLAACGQSDTKTDAANETKTEHNDLYFANDMENICIWNLKANFTKSAGHSGSYFSKADKDSPYSFGLNAAIKDLTTKKLKKVDISVWVSVANKDYSGSIVCSIFRKDSTVFWASSELKYFVSEPAKWCQATGKFEFPADIQENDQIAIYVWNAGEKSDIYVDDFEIQFYE